MPKAIDYWYLAEPSRSYGGDYVRVVILAASGGRHGEVVRTGSFDLSRELVFDEALVSGQR